MALQQPTLVIGKEGGAVARVKLPRHRPQVAGPFGPDREPVLAAKKKERGAARTRAPHPASYQERNGA